MGAVDTPERSRKKGKNRGVGRPKRRLGIRIDMTPMVDVAFLLLIFFMVTTVFRTPQALEINLPPDNSKVDVRKSNVVTVRVLPDHRVYYHLGDDPWSRTRMEDLTRVLASYRGNKNIVVLINIDREAPFDSMVRIIDELDRAGLTRFSLVTLTPEERQEVEGL